MLMRQWLRARRLKANSSCFGSGAPVALAEDAAECFICRWIIRSENDESGRSLTHFYSSTGSVAVFGRSSFRLSRRGSDSAQALSSYNIAAPEDGRTPIEPAPLILF